MPMSTHHPAETSALPRVINHEDLQDLGDRFISFLKKVGQPDTTVTREDAALLFASSCKKIVNGNVLFTSSDQHLEQIGMARRAVGKWIITKTIWSIASPEDRACSLQFSWTAERIGEGTTMVTLFIDHHDKIYEIHEVYNLSAPESLSIQE